MVNMDSVESRVRSVFMSSFEIDESAVENVEYQSVDTWDSIGHMIMISELESEFGITIDMDDVINISNLKTCIDKVSKYLK